MNIPTTLPSYSKMEKSDQQAPTWVEQEFHKQYQNMFLSTWSFPKQ